MPGTVQGIALAPGVSRNGRLYTADNIKKAYERMRARLADPNGSPIVMRTHHAAGDDSTRIVAQVKTVSLDGDGALHYESVFANTSHADQIRALAKEKVNGKPTLAHVSIYGWWINDPVKKVLDDGQQVETSDDLEIDAIDFTAAPGVAATTVKAESGRHAAVIQESHEAEITVTETATAVVEADTKPYGDVAYADPGYQADKKKRYPIDSASHVRSAWSFINADKNAAKYTAAQVKRIKTRIKSAAKKVGVKIEDSWLYSGTPLTESNISEYYGDYAMATSDGDWVQPATFCIDATNGPIRVSISSYCIDPADLEIVSRAAMQAANDALKAIDPDMDGDIDLPGTTGSDDNEDDASDLNNMESQETSATPPAETEATEVAQTEKESAVAENAAETTEGAATEAAPATVTEQAPAAAVIDYKALAEAIVVVLDARDEAKAAAETNTATTEAVTETATTEPAAAADQAQLREGLKEVVRELLAEGSVKPTRKGFGVTEQTEANPDANELWEKRGELFVAALQGK